MSERSLCLSMLLSTLETTIVSTSLVSIVNDLQGFSQAGWVVTAYFLTYTGESNNVGRLGCFYQTWQ
jgi:MFS family permease